MVTFHLWHQTATDEKIFNQKVSLNLNLFQWFQAVIDKIQEPIRGEGLSAGGFIVD